MSYAVNLLLRNTPENHPFDQAGEINLFQSHVREAVGWADLVATADNDDFELVIWKRSQSPQENLPKNAPISDFQITIGAHEDILVDFGETYLASDWPDDLYDHVVGDVRNCLNAFETEFPNSEYRVRLQAVTDDACRKFHQDRTFQRLIITYRGDGTVWRFADSQIEHETEAMDCILLRGKRAKFDTHIFHRSPRFVSGRPARLILVIDIIPNTFGDERL